MRGASSRGRRASALAAALLLPACAGLDPAVLGGVLEAGRVATLDESTIVAGLKQALEVGARNGVGRTSRTDGFWGDPRIRIPLPESLEGLAGGLRRVGLGGPVDEFERTMNRAAEQAAGEALPVLADAIGRMSFADARDILQGGETAATAYFRRATSAELTARFEPIVATSMQEVGLVRAYERLLAGARALPLLPRPELDLTGYVTERGLDGLFHVLGEEERKIRTDPAARGSELLRRVFGPA